MQPLTSRPGLLRELGRFTEMRLHSGFRTTHLLKMDMTFRNCFCISAPSSSSFWCPMRDSTITYATGDAVNLSTILDGLLSFMEEERSSTE